MKDISVKTCALIVVLLSGTIYLISTYSGSAIFYLRSQGSGNGIFYAIMFDAGSTGSRIHAYKFKPAATTGEPAELLGELFEQLKPGLSSYADQPKKGAESLVPLLEKAKKYIPEKQWNDTPMALKATAGLRLLPGTKSQEILAEVSKWFHSYPFTVYSDALQIMEGTDEGIFVWITANYLLGTMSDLESTYALFDLGGGSTQITFSTQNTNTINTSPKEYIKDISVFNKDIKLYTHSYLGYGLMSGRFQMMGGIEDPNNNQVANPNALYSPCFKAGFSDTWSHGNKKYTIKSKDNERGYEGCYKQALSLIKGKINKPDEVKAKKIMLISYYQERMADAGVIADTLGEADLTVQSYFTAAQKECSNPQPKDDFLCMDMTYMSTLLYDGFGFSKDTPLRVSKKIKDIEISWTLGATFSLLNKKNS